MLASLSLELKLCVATSSVSQAAAAALGLVSYSGNFMDNDSKQSGNLVDNDSKQLIHDILDGPGHPQHQVG